MQETFVLFAKTVDLLVILLVTDYTARFSLHHYVLCAVTYHDDLWVDNSFVENRFLSNFPKAQPGI